MDNFGKLDEDIVYELIPIAYWYIDIGSYSRQYYYIKIYLN